MRDEVVPASIAQRYAERVVLREVSNSVRQFMLTPQ